MKRRKLLCTVFVVIAVMLTFSFTSLAAETEGLYTYTVTNGEATITQVDSSVSGDVTIPETLGGYPVVAIGDDAFFDLYDIESVSIPNTVTSIGAYAFASCSILSEVVLPENLVTIGDGAFSMSSVKSYEIPASVTSIGKSALESFSVKSITVDKENPVYSSDDNGVLFNKEKTVLIQFPAKSDLTAYTVPASVTKIESYAFAETTKLKSITISNKVTDIPAGAFSESGIEFTVLPDSVKCIGQGAFEYCSKLKKIVVGTGLEEIKHDVFCDSPIEYIYYVGT